MQKQIKILVIDDDPFLNKVYINKLAQEGFVVLTAMDGIVGMQKIREQKPSLVVMDVVLPGKSGYDILQEVRRDPDAAIQATPIVIVSNLSQTKDVQEAMGLGAVDYLIKTQYTIDDILEKIKEYIRANRVKEVEVGEDEMVMQAQTRPRYVRNSNSVDLSTQHGFGTIDGIRLRKDICNRCGSPVAPGANFCPVCGNKL